MSDQGDDEFMADDPTEFWVCMPCLAMVPNRSGAIYVPGGAKGRVWCPWCGDAMNPDADEMLTPDELEWVKALKPEEHTDG